MSISVFIAGDVVPRNRTIPLFKLKDAKQLFGEMLPHINADLNIVNFEAPVVNGKGKSIAKSGPALKTSVETMECLKEAGFNILTLANNHFRDFGQQGVDDTISAANEINMEIVGGGKNKKHSRKFLVYEVKNKRIAIINACEHEFSIATDSYGGSNAIDLINMQEDIANARSLADYVILILHGGVEHFQYPTPRMKRWYRHFVNLGADAVINHHQHCLSGYEVYKGKPIFYGLGNFQFDSHKANKQPKNWNRGYAVRLELDNSIEFKIIPYIQNASDPTITLRDQEKFNEEIHRLNLVISDDYQLEQVFNELALKKKMEIYLSLFPYSHRWLDAFIRRGWLKGIFSKKKSIVVKNLLCCESHEETTRQLFEIRTK